MAGPPDASHQSKSISAMKETWPTEDDPRRKEKKHVRVTERSYRSPSHSHHHHHHHHRSSSSSAGRMTICADKDKRLNTKSRISGWLEDVEEGEYEENVW